MLRVVSHRVVANDSLPVHEAVVNSNFEPVLFIFPIKAFGKDKTSTVIDVTDLFNTDVKALGLPNYVRKGYKITRLDTKKSFIDSIKSYSLNIEARHVKTYAASAAPSNSSTGTVSVEMSNSMILLPKKPMKRRYFDERVGWFTSSQTDYGDEAQKSKSVTYLDRWRLEVKNEDLEKFRQGQLDYLLELTNIVKNVGGEGIIYWEPTWISTNCSTLWGKGSHWDNATTLFDHNYKANLGMQFYNQAFEE